MTNPVKPMISSRLIDLEVFENQCCNEILEISSNLISLFQNEGKLLICGNGGSAADAQHLAAEFISSFAVGLARKSLPAIALSVDTSVITAISNDFNYDMVFARQLQGLGTAKDGLMAISTSGESVNCLEAVKEARNIGMRTFALTKNPSSLFNQVDLAVGVPLANTQHIQECHVISYHIIAELVEEAFL